MTLAPRTTRRSARRGTSAATTKKVQTWVAVVESGVVEWRASRTASIFYDEIMAKSKSAKRNDASRPAPYDATAVKAKTANNIFKMNKDIGQHILKNPGIAQAIVEKAGLKQSDVDCALGPCTRSHRLITPLGRTRSRPWNGKSHRQNSGEGQTSDCRRDGCSYGGRGHEACAGEARTEETGGHGGRCDQDGASVFRRLHQ